MTKKFYIAPELDILDAGTEEILMVSPVATTGLGDENLTKDDTPGDSWTDAMGRSGAWDDEE